MVGKSTVTALEKEHGRTLGRRVWLGSITLILALWLQGAPALAADGYQPSNAGQPLRVAAYVVHPVGVVFDYLVLRPAYWIGSYQPFRTLFGRTDD